MTTRDLARATRRFWPLVLVIFLLFLAIGGALSFLPTKKYQASAILFGQPTNAQALASGATNVTTIILPGIVQQVETKQFATLVRSVDPSSRNASLSADNAAGTGVLTIKATSTDPRTAANAAATEVMQHPITTQLKLTVLNPAVAPSSAYSPRKGPILIGCIVLGAILGVLAALLADVWRKRLTGATMIRETFGLTVIGEIARTRHIRREPAELFGDAGLIEIIEDYQRLRTTFELLARDYHTVAVTSWAQGEGKTSVTTNLGWVLASLGRPVTIVDFDLRRPAVHRRFNLEAQNGVGEIGLPRPRRTTRLIPGGDGATVSRMGDYGDPADNGREIAIPARLKSTDLPRLTVLTAGQPVEQPPRVIERAYPLIRESLQDRLLLIDTPPLLAAESAMIASMVDALVIVIDMKRRDPADLQAMLQVLKLANTRILGVVLNRVAGTTREQRPPGYYYASPSVTTKRLGEGRTAEPRLKLRDEGR